MVFGLLVVGEVFWLATGVVFGLVAGTVFGLAVLGSMLSRFLNWLTDGTVGAVFGLVVLGSTLSSFFNWFADSIWIWCRFARSCICRRSISIITFTV